MPPTSSKPRLVILDSHGILYRAFFAFGSSEKPLMTSKGELTFATHGYAETLIRVFDQLRPTHILAAWDAHGKTFRHEASEAYKATRRETPSDLLPQMQRVRELLDAFNIPIIEYPGYEADDVAGTLAKRIAATGMETYIATLDTDLVQLIGPNIKLFMFRPYQRDTVEYDEKRAAERWGFSPIYMIDFKALKGDTSDNIDGIRGIGEKTATDLIRQFGPIESIYEHIDETKGALKQKLIDGEDIARRNKVLVTIETDLPIEFDLAAAEMRDFDRDRVSALFRELEFRMLAARLDEVLGPQAGRRQQAPEEEIPIDYNVVSDEATLRDVAAALQANGSFAVSALGSVTDVVHPLLLGLSLATAPGKAWYIPLGHSPRLDDSAPQLPIAVVREVLGPVLADPAIEKTTYGTKYLMHQLARNGMTLAGQPFDVNIAAFLLGETSSTVNALINERLGIELVSVVSLTGTGRSAITLAEVEIAKCGDHACQQAEMLLRIRPQLEAELNERGQWPLFNDMELPLVPVLFRMEETGIAVDVQVLRELSRQLGGDAAKAEQAIYDLVGHPFNIGSPQQLSDVLFKEMSLPKSRKTAQGYSTDQRALEALRPVTPVIDLIFEYRGLTKLKSTYTDALPGTIAEDGRIHTDFQQTVAATGRLSSTNPNLQNIPVRTDTGRDIRRAFVASYFDDPIFVAADYSQIELRILAHITEDPGLIEAFLADQDIHRATAATVYGVEPEAVTRQMRDTAKMVNFGIAYGMGEFGLASRTGMTREEADAFIKTYFQNFQGIAEWQQTTLASTREKGYAETLFGRRRYLPAIRSTNFQVRSAAEREAINMPIQGTAADIIKVAMIRVDEALRERGLQSRMILQVHDELIFECPMDEADAVGALARELMPGTLDLKAPLKVDVKRGKDWGRMEATG
ncbi:MAG TPA: DNA polymerase I [Tepidiformaceae bacterium]|nr:DNA polymerase I [Tepidiformaceae bacterium]